MEKGKIVKKEFYVWLAGFVDGEGSISVHRRNSKHTSEIKIRIRIGNTCPYIFPYIKDQVGGNMKKVRKSINPQKSDQYGISWSGNKALEILKELIPYLKIKTPQALMAMEFPMGIRGRHITKLQQEKRRKIAKILYNLNIKGKDKKWISGIE